MPLARIRRRIEKSVLQYGVLATVGRCLIFPFLYLGWRIREQMPFERERRRAGAEFDRQHGVDTTRTRSTEWVADVDSENWAEGTGYAASPPDTVRRCVRSLPIDPGEFVFIDLGSGKGRVMLVASEFPFRECLGVEYDPSLHEIAVRNIAAFHDDRQRCKVIRSYCHDATTFALPDAPLVLFFAHPFGGAVLDRLLENIGRSLRQTPRRVYVVYYDPICGDRFENAGFREIGSYDLPKLHTFRNRRGKEFVLYENDVSRS